MEDTIREIINAIPPGMIFDSHTVIFILLQKHSDVYLSNFTRKTTELYNGYIGQIISSLENELGLQRVGDSYSKNIRDKFSKCSCWQKKYESNHSNIE